MLSYAYLFYKVFIISIWKNIYRKIFAEKNVYLSNITSPIPSCSNNFGLNNNTLYNISQKSCENHSTNEIETLSQQGNTKHHR